MTEDEAKTKICHQTLSPAMVTKTGHPVSGTIPMANLCIGSACMAWRSRPQWRERSDKKWEDEVPPDHPRGPNNQVREAGYCGLAGKPE